MASVKHFALPICLNLVVPGTGLPVVGRPWLGVLLAGVFLMGGELAILGWLVAPAWVPLALTLTSAAIAAVAWLVAQFLLIARIRFLRSPELPRELAILRRLARAAIRRQDYGAAQSALAIAFSLDDSDLECHLLQARLLSATGQRAKARRAWLAVRSLDTAGEHADEINHHLLAPSLD
jgi:hypothetical protein